MTLPVPLIVHVAAGALGLATGAVALSVRKGGRAHRRWGTAFFVAMLAMAGMGGALAAVGSERGTAAVGLFTVYLLATSWAAARRRDGGLGRFERGAFWVAAGITVAMLAMGVLASTSANHRFDSLPAAPHYAFALVAAIAAAADLKLIRQGGITGAPRIRRHLWRMCTAFLIAAFSFFMGQQKVMPLWMRGSPWLFVPEALIFGSMVFWMFRTRARRWQGRFTRAEAAGG